VVIDPFTPLMPASAAVVDVLDRSGCTSMVTYPADVSQGYDARLAPVVQQAAAILQLTRGDAGLQQLRIVQARWRSHESPPAEVMLMTVPPRTRSRARKATS
jgi:hypothetical protein